MDRFLAELYSLMSPCTLCPRRCGARRTSGELGFCRMPAELHIASVGPHFGEEAPLVGKGGSGTIFLSGCNLLCVFCQNWEISHQGRGRVIDLDDLVTEMLSLQQMGCENINFVSPTHYAPSLAEAVTRSREQGLRVPIVYNCGGYEREEVLQKLDGIVDIYMPDIKFTEVMDAEAYLQSADYPRVARKAVQEMHRQVGDLQVCNGVAVRGLLVRHLVMPGGLQQAEAVIDFLADEVSAQTYINVMGQYRPCYRAGEFAAISHRPTPREWEQARAHAVARGLRVDP